MAGLTKGDTPTTRPDLGPVDHRQVQTVCLLILALLAVGVGLYLLKPLLVPFVLAVFLTYCLIPVIDLLKRHLHLPEPVALVGAGLMGMLMLGLVGYLLSVAIVQIRDKFGVYEARVNGLVERVQHQVPLDKLGIKVDEQSGSLFTVSEEQKSRWRDAVLSEATEQASRAGLVLLFMVFLLLGRKRENLTHSGLLSEVEVRVRRFVTRIVFFSALTGVMVWLPLQACGVEFALVFGFLAFLLNFIPSIGSLVATVLPMPVILLSNDLSLAQMVVAMVVPVVAQVIIGVAQPKFVGNSLDLHPVAVVMSLIFFGMIWGTVGAFLAAPTMAVIKIVLEKSPATRPIASVLAGDLGPLSRPHPPLE